MASSTSWGEIKKSFEKNSRKESEKNFVDMLQNRLHFPTFSSLPYDHHIDERYHVLDKRMGVYMKGKTWCFLGEIYNDELSQHPFLRNRVYLTDRDGFSPVPVFFYPESGYFDYSQLRNGRTLAVLYAEYHHFLDGQIGLRIENLDTVTVLNCRLEQLFSLSAHYWSHKGKEKCWTCGKNVSAEELKKCARCKVAKYCDKNCQKKDWTERHKVWCRVMPEFLTIASFDYDVYKDSQYFGGLQLPF
jgi:hypothetical protein